MWQSAIGGGGEKYDYATDILLNGKCLICFFVMWFYIERKWRLMRNLARNLPYNVIDVSIKMLKNSWIYKIFN